LKLRLASAGSLPPMGDPMAYPFSHIEYWLERQLELGYPIVGTGEPGGRNRYGMVERFTQDIGGVEIRFRGGKAESYCTGKIKPTLKPSSEVAEAKHLASIAPSAVLMKAAITDPVTIGFELVAKNPRLVKTYPEIYDDVTEALKPIVGALSDYADIVQFDCPVHVTRSVKEPWRYLNELAKATRKRAWIHIDGYIGRMLPSLIREYDVDVLNVNLFGKEGEGNFAAIAEHSLMLRDGGKKLAPALVNTQIRDRNEEVESVELILERINRLSSHLGLDMLEAVTPGCGLRLLPCTAQAILERLRKAVLS